ncbi:MAG: hypothetical protein KF901_30460 [Myxococcales bacterium]|nr:hypothetical protein [Myxococcales bacterium]
MASVETANSETTELFSVVCECESLPPNLETCECRRRTSWVPERHDDPAELEDLFSYLVAERAPFARTVFRRIDDNHRGG